MAYPKLKACPTCSGPMTLYGYEGWNGSISSWRAECADDACGYIGSCEGRKLDAIRQHNSRQAPTPQLRDQPAESDGSREAIIPADPPSAGGGGPKP